MRDGQASLKRPGNRHTQRHTILQTSQINYPPRTDAHSSNSPLPTTRPQAGRQFGEGSSAQGEKRQPSWRPPLLPPPLQPPQQAQEQARERRSHGKRGAKWAKCRGRWRWEATGCTGGRTGGWPLAGRLIDKGGGVVPQHASSVCVAVVGATQ